MQSVKKSSPPAGAVCAACFRAKPVLTVYTYDSFSADWGPGPVVKKAFEADCNCELKFVALEDGVSLLNRLRMEGKNSKADVVLGLDNNLLEAATQTRLFAKSGVAAGCRQRAGRLEKRHLCAVRLRLLCVCLRQKQAEKPAEKPERAGGKRPEMARDL